MTGVRWGVAHEFAEVAETLAIPTDHVMAWSPELGVVAYTPDTDDATIWTAALTRDTDGLLIVVHRQARPGLWEAIMADLEGK